METNNARYFVIFFQAFDEEKGHVGGNFEMATYDGKYISKKQTEKNISTAGLKKGNIVITNIIELNEVEFDEWRAE